jgi:hypothetical protein
MGRILVVSVTSFCMAVVAVAGLDAYTARWPSAAQAVWLVVSERPHAPRPPRVCCGPLSARNAMPANQVRSPRSAALGNGALASIPAGGVEPPGADLPRPQRRTP